MADVIEEREEKDAKYITATLSKTEDAETIGKYGRLVKIGGFSAKEIFELGIDAAASSDKYQKALRAIKSELQ